MSRDVYKLDIAKHDGAHSISGMTSPRLTEAVPGGIIGGQSVTDGRGRRPRRPE
jgi:hypothetical protein